MGSNNLDSNGSDDNDDDDDFDGEALLYKMMQQQNFLMNPSWQGQQQSVANSNNLNQDAGQQQQSGLSANLGNDQSLGQQQQLQKQREDALSDSKKVIKLLKSYSHIHQVDDSDDQIRGTYTRLSAYRPTAMLSGKNQYSHGR